MSRWTNDHLKGRFLMLGILFLTWWHAGLALGETAGSRDNGATVTRPKQYPYRHLEKMIADLDAQLAQIRAIQAEKITQQIDALQGSSSRSRAFSVTAEQLPVPGVTTNLEAGEDGELVPKTATVTEPAVTPAAPALGALSAGGLPSPTFGLAASDLLAKQVQLQNEVYSLRLLQQRSISDRFLDDGRRQGSGAPPNKPMKLTIRPQDGDTKRPSLVALLPEEKTYNAVAHSSKSGDFGGAALAGVFSLGFASKWKSENLYLYQDSDTLAFERPADSPDSPELRFGWQFRPVLGRKFVDPGRRHLFAVLALDELEQTDDEDERERRDERDNQGSGIFPYEVTARSHWVGYSSKHRVTRGQSESHWSSGEEPWTSRARRGCTRA